MAERAGGAETIDFSKDDVYDRLMAMTAGRGPDSCIDAVGAEAHGRGSFDAVLDKVKTAVYLATDVSTCSVRLLLAAGKAAIFRFRASIWAFSIRCR